MTQQAHNIYILWSQRNNNGYNLAMKAKLKNSVSSISFKELINSYVKCLCIVNVSRGASVSYFDYFSSSF